MHGEGQKAHITLKRWPSGVTEWKCSSWDSRRVGYGDTNRGSGAVTSLDDTVMRVLSLGGGVQSSCLALKIAKGELPPVEAAYFADTEDEPAKVYDWLNFLTAEIQKLPHPFPIHRVGKGEKLSVAALRVRTSESGTKYTQHATPGFLTDGRSTGMLMRQCTADFKIRVLHRAYNRDRAERTVVQLIGISFDELHRMKPSGKPWLLSEWPLVENRTTRLHCHEWMKQNGYPQAPRSACIQCGYHSDQEWSRMKRETPLEFAIAVKYDHDYREALSHTGMRGRAFLHRSLQPLDQVNFDEQSPQVDMFGNECEGMCGV